MNSIQIVSTTPYSLKDIAPTVEMYVPRTEGRVRSLQLPGVSLRISLWSRPLDYHPKHLFLLIPVSLKANKDGLLDMMVCEVPMQVFYPLFYCIHLLLTDL